ncbi:797_t:CDS:2, partial [Rhizophagus irregularis]
IHLITDLWTSKSRHSYLGVTATWLSSDFKFREVLLSCNHIEYPHTGEVISEELFQIIHRWRLDNTVFTIVTDNAANMLKGIELLHNNYFNVIRRQPCAAHTLQLSVQERLKQCKEIHCHIKNLQNFFRLPKQAQRLLSPLDVLTDTRTRWNSTYLPWKRVLELHNAMRFLQEMMKLLEPIERVTRCLCGAEYPTLSFVYPYMELLKKKFAPKDNKSVQTYINLIYGESYEDDDDSVTDDDIPTAGAHQHWQYAHRQFCQKMKNTH